MELNQLRELKLLSEREDIGFKELVKSIIDEYVTQKEVENCEYFVHCGMIYSSDNYCEDSHGDLLLMEEAFWCEDIDEWVHVENTRIVCVNRGTERISDIAIERGDYYFYGGDVYDSDALDFNNLVVDVDGDVRDRDDVYYWEGDGEWHDEPEDNDEDSDEYVRGYHNGSYRSVNFDGKSKYKIGFEIEKEDSNVKESISINSFESATDYNWRKESDGSLDCYSGFELVSPTFEFNIDKIFELIENNDYLVDHINAKYSTSCGGHINLSEAGLSGNKMFDKIKGYTPLFYALYHGRVDKNYSKAKSNVDLKNDNEKYQAIKIHDNRIEFRIISAVPNVTTLKWRCRLIDLILKHSTGDVRDAYYYFDTKFDSLIREVYNTDDKYNSLKNRLKKYTLDFENVALKDKEKRPYKKRNINKVLANSIPNTISPGHIVIVVNTEVDDNEWDCIGRVNVRFFIGALLTVKEVRFNSDGDIRGLRFLDNITDDYVYPISMFGTSDGTTSVITI